MRQNKVILSLGSNRDRETNIRSAGYWLRACFATVSFSDVVYTKSIGYPEDDIFLNQVAVAYTDKQPETIQNSLKEIEIRLGRTKEGKVQGNIPIDIDLLQWNEQVLKPDDLKREYIRSLLQELDGK